MNRKLLRTGIRAVDLLGLPLTYLSGLWLRSVRRALHRMPMSKGVLEGLGILPVLHHYYEPVIYKGDLGRPLTEERTITGLDLNVKEQLELLKRFGFNAELAELPLEDPGNATFFFHNSFFESGDAEYYFNMIRCFKPETIIEVGAGYSTLLGRCAIDKNFQEDPNYSCRHICIEPFEHSWLESTGAEIVREKVESLDVSFFKTLNKNDILLIDSSHVIRPQGDVLFLYQRLLGSLNSGVFIHAHDIFTPRDYPERWVVDESKMWNEQYILEALISSNEAFRVTGSLNYLWHNHREQLTRVCPVLAQEPNREPASFWFVRN